MVTLLIQRRHTAAAASSVKDAQAQPAAPPDNRRARERKKSQLCAPWDVETTAAPCVTNARKKILQSTHTPAPLHSEHTDTHTAWRKWKV